MSLSGSAVSVADPVWQLGTVPTTTNTDAAYATAALGNNSALTNIEFSGFKYNETSGTTGITTITSGTTFDKIDSNTWTQVSKLMNMFAKYDTTSQSVTNLTPWAVSTGGSEGGSSSTGVIQADIGDGKLNSRTDDGTKWTGESTDTGIVTANTTSATLTHNGVTWNYKKDTSNNEITITGTGINIYKAKNGNNGYQTYFAAPSSGTNPTQAVTVKITLVPKTAVPGAKK